MKSQLLMMNLALVSQLLVTEQLLGATTDEILKGYAVEAKQIDASFKQFEAARGKELYFLERKTSKGKMASCSECHTKNPAKEGKTRAGKVIEPMASSVNPKRFTDKAKVEKWFKRNCDDVFERPCTALEKGDFIKFLQSI